MYLSMTRTISVVALAFALAISSITPCQAQWGIPSAGRSGFARPAAGGASSDTVGR